MKLKNDFHMKESEILSMYQWVQKDAEYYSPVITLYKTWQRAEKIK